ncbi:hypothetical protein U1Q18_051921, partial [Sarracenia purpurea var. burkii]
YCDFRMVNNQLYSVVYANLNCKYNYDGSEGLEECRWWQIPIDSSTTQDLIKTMRSL